MHSSSIHQRKRKEDGSGRRGRRRRTWIFPKKEENDNEKEEEDEDGDEDEDEDEDKDDEEADAENVSKKRKAGKGDEKKNAAKAKKRKTAEEDTDKPKESPFEIRSKRLAEKIKKLEDANVAPKPWAMTGEVNAYNRPINSLLETHLEYESSYKVTAFQFFELIILYLFLVAKACYNRWSDTKSRRHNQTAHTRGTNNNNYFFLLKILMLK